MNEFQPDILGFLAEIVRKNTRAYTTDFDYMLEHRLESQNKCPHRAKRLTPHR